MKYFNLGNRADLLGLYRVANLLDKRFGLIAIAAYTYKGELEKLNSKAARKQVHYLLKFEQDAHNKVDAYDKDHIGNAADLSNLDIKIHLHSYKLSEITEADIDRRINEIKINIMEQVPLDISESEQGLCVAWLRKQFFDPRLYWGQLRSVGNTRVESMLEKFFQYQQYIPPEHRDLFKLSFQNLFEVVDAAIIEKNRRENEKFNDPAFKAKGLADSEKVYENDEWSVWEPKSMAASCYLGSGTNWCTAVNSKTNLFDHYSKQGRLFVIISKKDPKEKYQYHYESGQLMDSKDHKVPNGKLRADIINLIQTIHGKSPYAARHSAKFENNEFQEKEYKYDAAVPEYKVVTERPNYHKTEIFKHTPQGLAFKLKETETITNSVLNEDNKYDQVSKITYFSRYGTVNKVDYYLNNYTVDQEYYKAILDNFGKGHGQE